MERSNVGLKIGMDGMCDAKPATRQITKIDRYMPVVTFLDLLRVEISARTPLDFNSPRSFRRLKMSFEMAHFACSRMRSVFEYSCLNGGAI